MQDLGGMAIGLLCGLSTMERLSSDFFGMEENCWSQTKQIVVRFLGLIISVIGIIIRNVRNSPDHYHLFETKLISGEACSKSVVHHEAIKFTVNFDFVVECTCVTQIYVLI
jgi:hypothetical protein